MAMDPKDLKLPGGGRQPSTTVRNRSSGLWNDHARRFEHKRLAHALAALTKPAVKA